MLNSIVKSVSYLQVYVLHSTLLSSLCETMKNMKAGL